MAHIAQRRFGQNFLVDANIARKIIQSAAISPDETVIEIGPGQGAITRLLAEKSKTVIAIELDHDLIQGLNIIAKEHHNVTIIQGDALKVYNDIISKIGDQPYLVVANIPYNITSSIIRTMLTAVPPASRAILMVQKEVATRMIAKAGDMSLLSLSVQLYANVRKCFDVSPASFRPRPRVHSAVIEITPNKDSARSVIDPEVVLSFARHAFAKKRKLLASNLADATAFVKTEIIDALSLCNIPINARAQDLSVAQWRALCTVLTQ